MGHLEAIYLLYGYLKAHDRSTMVFDDEYVNWNDNDFSTEDWSDFYRDAREKFPCNAPKPRGMLVQVNAFVYASHARNKHAKCSHTGIIIYLNKSPIIRYSKAQQTVETSMFSSKFIALKTGTKLIKSFRYKIMIMGIPLDRLANVLADSNSILKNCTIPASTLQKKHNSICYHYAQEVIAVKCIRIAFVPSSEN